MVGWLTGLDDKLIVRNVRGWKGSEPLPCGAQNRDDPKLFCVSEVGHAGRHAYRRIARMH